MTKYVLLLNLILLFTFSCCSSESVEGKTKDETKTVLPIKKNKKKGKSTSKVQMLNRTQLLKARQTKKKPAYRFGKINEIQFDKLAKQKKQIFIKDNFLHFTNTWAYDNLSNKAGAGAMIRIDKEYYKIQYGISRPDVSKYLKLRNTLNCGIVGKVDISKLKPGMHTLSICLLGTNKLYYLESDPIKFKTQ